MNKVALITGGSRGIGKAIALKLAKDGYDVIINYSGNDQKANETVNELIKLGSNATAFKADVRNFKEVNLMAEYVIKNYQRIDLLVNNSGITKDTLMLRMTEDDFNDVIDVNLKGTFNVTKAFTRSFFKQKDGNIINISSVIGEIGNIGQANYAASKAGIIGFTKSIAKEYGERNIRVNCICPGFIQTDMTEQLDEKLKAHILNNIVLKELGKPEDVANLVSFLASSNSRYITGQVINICGGMVI